jgi:hypothetical protein
MGAVIHIPCIIGTGIHAVATENTLLRIYSHLPLFTVVGSLCRADHLARCLFTMLTLAGIKSIGSDTEIWPLPLDLFNTNPNPVFSSPKQYTVLLFAGYLARFAVNTVFIV